MAGKSNTAIFQDDGEIYFRELEIEAIKQAAAGEKKVIACGAGRFEHSQYRPLEKKRGCHQPISQSRNHTETDFCG